jgi:hypothetical protein
MHLTLCLLTHANAWLPATTLILTLMHITCHTHQPAPNQLNPPCHVVCAGECYKNTPYNLRHQPEFMAPFGYVNYNMSMRENWAIDGVSPSADPPCYAWHSGGPHCVWPLQWRSLGSQYMRYAHFFHDMHCGKPMPPIPTATLRDPAGYQASGAGHLPVGQPFFQYRRWRAQVRPGTYNKTVCGQRRVKGSVVHSTIALDPPLMHVLC